MKIIYLGLICLIIASCTSQEASKEGAEKLSLGFEPTDERILFELDSFTPNVGIMNQYKSGYFYNLNPQKNTIYRYKLGEKSIDQQIIFEREGPNSMSIFGFHVHTPDSIFLFPRSGGEIAIVNAKGQWIREIKYEVPSYHTNAFVLSSYMESRPYFIEESGILLVKTHIDGDHSQLSKEELSERMITYAIPFNQDAKVVRGHNYPKDYWKGGKKLFEPSFAVSKNGRVVYSLFGSHDLYYADQLGEKLKTKTAKSTFLPEKIPLLPEDGSPLEKQKYFQASPHYRTVTYDPYRSVFLRFVYPEPNLERIEQDEIRELQRFPQTFSIQIFNENLDLLGEELFEKNSFIPAEFFITEEGLYISESHVRNENQKEDELSFRLFKIVERD
ncbi:MAG: DUF4221 domain-containing protein [Cyclobacteriaceae bacterium]|nr:DUF4221 family protein [Cyclobacteriaceae bacterium]MCH8515354.1 DUF4221 domain-containing protein [Cyclobacteriaceae bacterium]